GLGIGVSFSYAGEVDILLQKLVEKGVLTPGEAQQVGTETKEQVKQEIAAGKYSSLPEWVQNTKLKGDFRLRFQNLHEKNAGDISKDTTIGRIRLRLGLDSKVNDKLKVGVGIATGSGDPRSTNISFGGYSSKKSIYLDYAYAKYDPLPWLNLVGGKMLLPDVLWEPTDLIWDTDITPEGAVIGFNKVLDAKTSVFMKAGPLVLVDDTSTTSGANAFLVQPGINYTLNDRVSVKGAVTYEYFQTKDSAATTYSKGQNTRIGGSYAYNYSDISPALEFSIKEPFKAFGLNVENLKLFGEYVNNFAVSNKNSGFSTGFQFGNEKIEKWGDWQVRYIYAMLAKDAVLDILPDSDRLSGKTGMRSHEGILTFGLAKNTFLAFDVYRSWSLVGAKAPETLVQVDWNMKF
ncbi:MAG: putative porin, partial [Candidatus Omnitrophota bacterium]